MELSAQALQASVDDLNSKVNSQQDTIQVWRDEILALHTERIELELLLKQKDFGGYDPKSMRGNIARINRNVKDFEEEIRKMEQKTSEYKGMIVVLEAKRDSAKF